MLRSKIILFNNLLTSVRLFPTERVLKDLDMIVLKNIDINYNGGELIREAISSHRIEVVRMLLEKGAIIPPNFNALHKAIYTRFHSEEELIALVDLLLQQGIDINDKTRGASPLAAAILFRKVEVLRFLIEKGANCKKGMLRYTVEAPIDDKIDKNIEILDIIIENGARPALYEDSLLFACYHPIPNLIIIEKLLNIGVDPNIRDILKGLVKDIIDNIRMKKLRNADQYQIQSLERQINVRIQIIELLLKYGLDPRINISQEEQTILKDNYPQIQELLSEKLLFWRPFYQITRFDFRLERPHVYGACSAVLLCGERLDNLSYIKGDLHQMETLPPEIWIHIMSFLNMRDMGNFSNRGSQRFLTGPVEETEPSSSPPKIEEIEQEQEHEQEQEQDNNSDLSNWVEVGEQPQPQPEQPEPRKSILGKLFRRTKGAKGGGKKDNTNKQKIFDLVKKILNMKDRIFENKCEELIGITIYELESLTYMMENMTKEGIHKIPLFLKVSDKVSKYIKTGNKNTMKSTTMKKKNTMKSTTMKKKTTMKSSIKKKKHIQKKKKHTQNKMRMKQANIKNLTFYNNPIQV